MTVWGAAAVEAAAGAAAEDVAVVGGRLHVGPRALDLHAGRLCNSEGR